MNKSYVLGVGILGLSLLSSVAVTYATDETLEEQDSSVVFSHHLDKKEKKSEGKRDFKMEMKAPKGFKELTDEEKAEFEAKKLEMQENMKTEFQEKLSKGEITQEEYDTFIENLENGKIGCPMEGKRKMGVFKGENNEENKEAPKDFKELTDEEKAEFEAKKLEMQENMKTKFQEKLSKGEITQEEYDTFIENLENGKIGCPMEGKRKIGVFKGENNEENKEAGQFKMMKKIGKKVHAFTKTTSEQE